MAHILLTGVNVYSSSTTTSTSTASSTTTTTSTAGMDTDAQAFITAASISNGTQQSAINTLVGSLKSAGIWTKMQAIYPFVGGSEASHQFNLKNPLNTDAAFRVTFPNSATHNSDGVGWNGANQYGNTHVIPDTAMTLNSTHLSYYTRDNINPNGIEMGTDDIVFQINFGAGDHSMRLYGNGTGTVNSAAVSNSSGFFVASRTSSTSLVSYRNGASVASQTGTNTTTPVGVTDKLYMGAKNNFGVAANFTTRQCAFASVGTGLTGAEVTAFYNAVQAYQTSLGRNV